MKQAIVVVFHGCSDEEINEQTSSILTKQVKDKYKEYDIFEVFTSKIVISRLINKRLDFKQCLDLLTINNYDSIYILTTNLISGIELINIKNLLKNTSINYYITEALFDNKATINKISQIIAKDNDEINLFVGHGSKQKNNNGYLALEHAFIQQGYHNHFICLIDGQPTYQNIEQQLDKTKIINIYPLMFVAGYHAKKDVRQLASNIILDYPKVNYHNISLGMISEIRELYLDNLNKIIKNNETA